MKGKVNYTTITIFRLNYFVMWKVYTNVGGIKQLNHVSPPVRKIIHSLKLVDYLHVHADNSWYNYYLASLLNSSATYLFQLNEHVEMNTFSCCLACQ